MTLPLVFSPGVREEVDEAYTWYETQRPGLGEEFLAAVQTTLRAVRENPAQYGFVYREARAALTRRFPYVVYYRHERDRVVVVAIQHAGRDPRSWQSRL